MMSYLVLFGVIALVSWLVSSQLKSRFKRYSKIPIGYALTGGEIAQRMLEDHGIYDISIGSSNGELSDHYHPIRKQVNLSPSVARGNSIAAAAVAAHECGHAVQYAKGYGLVKMRTALVPVLSLTSNWVPWLILGGILMIETFPALLLAGIILFALSTLFSFVTLPVEIDASRRALIWLENSGITNNSNHYMAKDALKWAAYTYLVAALSSLASLIYYLMIFLGSRD